MYRKNLKLWTPETNNCCNYPKISIVWFKHRVLQQKDAVGMANSVNPDQE